MPRATETSRTEFLHVTLSRFGQDFPFRLYSRPLPLGSGVTAQYYWMDSSDFRSLRTEAEAINFRSCIGHWAASMRSRGLHHDLEQQIHYVLALC